jgi:hypothetical protein
MSEKVDLENKLCRAALAWERADHGNDPGGLREAVEALRFAARAYRDYVEAEALPIKGGPEPA